MIFLLSGLAVALSVFSFLVNRRTEGALDEIERMIRVRRNMNKGKPALLLAHADFSEMERPTSDFDPLEQEFRRLEVEVWQRTKRR